MGFWPGFRAAVRSCGSASSLNAYLTQVQITFFPLCFLCFYTKITANSKMTVELFEIISFCFMCAGVRVSYITISFVIAMPFLVHCTQKTYFCVCFCT